MFDAVPVGGKGNPPLRWKDQVERDVFLFGISNWSGNCEEKKRMSRYCLFVSNRVSSAYANVAVVVFAVLLQHDLMFFPKVLNRISWTRNKTNYLWKLTENTWKSNNNFYLKK